MNTTTQTNLYSDKNGQSQRSCHLPSFIFKQFFYFQFLVDSWQHASWTKFSHISRQMTFTKFRAKLYSSRCGSNDTLGCLVEFVCISLILKVALFQKKYALFYCCDQILFFRCYDNVLLNYLLLFFQYSRLYASRINIDNEWLPFRKH